MVVVLYDLATLLVAARALTAPGPERAEWTVEGPLHHLASGYVNVVVQRRRGSAADAPREDLQLRSRSPRWTAARPC
jgi:hypothetical protein